jgi:1-phosphatidylinositol phosphodiesterase
MTLDLSEWMRRVPGAKKLSELSIPGTHDSGARDPAIDDAIQKTRLTTQTRTVKKQLEDGIRFLDIRVRYIDGKFALYHEEVSLNLDFERVRIICKSFLAAHPRETIIMSIKEESTATGNTAGVTFQDRFDQYVNVEQNLWYLLNAIPTLGDVRGKIVLFRRFPLDRNTTTPRGIDAYPFVVNATFTIPGLPKLEIQDGFLVEIDENKPGKYTNVESLLTEASEPSSDMDALYVNFASGAGGLPRTTPKAVSDFINPKLVTYFTDHPQGRFGIVVTDFETTQLNTLIVQTNVLRPAPQ